MLALRKRLTTAAAAVWGFWLLAVAFGWTGAMAYPTRFGWFQFVLAALAQASLWLGILLSAGALFTHILIVRDNELYEPAAAAGCECGDGCCPPADQSNISS